MRTKTALGEDWLALFCANLKMAMHQKGVSQKELSALSGLAEAQLSRYVKGRREPGLRTICRLAGALDISPALLLCPAAERFILSSPCWKVDDLQYEAAGMREKSRLPDVDQPQ